MTKKDYVTAAKLIKEFENDGNFSRKSDKKNLILFLSEFFRQDNPRFDRNRFLKECSDEK